MFVKIILLVAMAYAVNAYPFYGAPEYHRTPLGDSIDKASMKLLHEAYKAADDKNVIASPLGVMLLLSLYSAGAGPQSKEQISQFLGGGDSKQLTESYSDLSKRLAEEDPSYLTVANKIYVSNRYTLADTFSSTARTYESEVDTINFVDKEAAAATINSWADEKTKGHIKDPVNPDSLGPDTAAAMFNVIFFQGHWHVPFQASETQEKDFHVDKTTTVKKPMMHLTQSLFYTENKDLGFRMIELPYKESGFRMVVVLPDEIDGLSKMMDKMVENKTSILDDIFNLAPAGREIDLFLPKFDIKCKLDLNDILPKVGVKKIFEEPAPEIVKDDTVVVSEAFQEAFIKLDEEGATAGAFTGIVAVNYSSDSTTPPAMEFKVDHPFLTLILHEDKIIFAGTYTH